MPMLRRILAGLALPSGVVVIAAAFAISASAPSPPGVTHDADRGLGGLDLKPYRNETVGDVTSDTVDPDGYLTSFETGTVSKLPDGGTLRVFEIHSINKTIEIAPGVFFPAWTFNGQVPGPTLRATDGDRIRIRFTTVGDRLYHCHATPLTQHIHNGLYGFWIVDPKEGRPPAREMVMMMNGFDPNFDEENEVYAVNTVAFHYARHPIEVRQNEPIRIYLANITEFDLLNSFHIHATFFDYYPTGTQKEPRDYTDTVVLRQAERGIVAGRLPHPRPHMFH